MTDSVREKWILQTKKEDFYQLASQLGISPLIVRCMVNRDVRSFEAMQKYLHGSLSDLYDPYLLKDVDKSVGILKNACQKKQKIAIASDFDCDGIFSGYLLWRAFGRIGLDARIFTPDRVLEGYGLNARIVEEAVEQNREVLVTCDNGIAANEAIELAKEKGLTVIVTDHHEVQERMPVADAVVDPKRPDETYPFSGLCGAGVAFKLIQALYRSCGIPEEETESLLEYVAIATVADVMELKDENRILVKEGLRRLEKTQNIGLRELLKVQNLDGRTINAGHVGFIIGPCFNAAGRIATVRESFDLLMESDETKAGQRALRLKEINESRKEMTEQGTERALKIVEQKRDLSGRLPDILTILVPDVHESLVGIIAGRIKEKYYHPTIVFTRVGDGLIKGSGRSLDSYHMFQKLMKCKDLMVHFGGHKMAAGMTMRESDFLEFERRLNTNSGLTDEDFCPVVKIDAPMPIGYVTERLIEEFSFMEPFGVGNPKPIFAEQHFKILRARALGKEKNILKLRVRNERGSECDAMMFRGKEEFEAFVVENWGEAELQRMYQGKENYLDVAFTYFPSVNEYQGNRTIQIEIIGYCRVG